MVKTIGGMNKNFKYHKLCKICNARNPLTKEEIRPLVEQMKAEGKSFREIGVWGLSIGVPINDINLTNHFKKHAPYVIKGSAMSPTTKRMITKLTISSEESLAALKKVIAIGSQMIDNWWNGVEGEPQMRVTPGLFVSALKEEGRRAPKTALDAEFELLQKEAIEGEVVSNA